MNQKFLKTGLTTFIAAMFAIAYAAPVEVEKNEPIEFSSSIRPPRATVEQRKEVISADKQPAVQVVNVTIEQMIVQLLKARDWKRLSSVLYQYNQQERKDVVLLHYALGALQRAAGLQSKAIETYQKIATHRPNLIYPQFDLAIMLLEDHQYRESKAVLLGIRDKADEALKKRIDQYLALIDKRQGWTPYFGMQYTETDNVNNAASSDVVMINGLKFYRSADSMPQSAHGVSYNLGVTKRYQIQGHHGIYANFGVEGIHYWDAKDYREISYRSALGYMFKDIKNEVRVVPFLDYNRLGGEAYSRYWGSDVSYSRIISPTWLAYGSYRYLRKAYADPQIARRYDSYTHRVSVGSRWRVHPGIYVNAGLDYSNESALDPTLSSIRQGVSAGLYYDRVWGMSVRGRYGTRDFKREHALFAMTRKDKEYSLTVSLWHNKLQWRGFQPRLNYQYTRTKSNMEQLYSRQGSTFFVNVEKDF